MTEYYNDLCNLLIRPTRQKYHLYDLGNPLISGHGKRIDFQILSSLNLKLKCSYYYMIQQNLHSPVLLYLHSFNGSRLQSISYVQALMEKGFNVLSFDFAGCGISQGDYVTLGSRQKDDVLTLLRYMHRKFYCTQFAIWGRSMGAVTAIKVCKLLQDHKLKSNQLRQISIISLILDSPFISLNRLAVQIAKQKISAPQLLIKVIFMMMKSTIQDKAHFDINSLELTQDLKSIKFPTLILCSKKDTLISCKHSQQIYQLIKNSPQKQLVYIQSQHNQSRKQSDLNKVYEFLVNQHDKSLKKLNKNNKNNPFLSNSRTNLINNQQNLKNPFVSCVFQNSQRPPTKSRSLLKNQLENQNIYNRNNSKDDKNINTNKNDFYKSQSIDRTKLIHNGSCKDTLSNLAQKHQSPFSKKVVNINQLLAQKKSKSINKEKTNKNIININANANFNSSVTAKQSQAQVNYQHESSLSNSKNMINNSSKTNLNIINLNLEVDQQQNNQNNQNHQNQNANYWSSNSHNKITQTDSIPIRSTSTRNLQSQKQKQYLYYQVINVNEKNQFQNLNSINYSSQNKKVFFSSSSIVDSDRINTNKNIRLLTQQQQKQKEPDTHMTYHSNRNMRDIRNNKNNDNYSLNSNNFSNNTPVQTTFITFLASIPEAQSVEKNLKNNPSVKNININKSSLKSSKKLIKISTDQQNYNKMNQLRFRQNQDDQEVQEQVITRQDQCRQHLNVITAKLKKKKSTKRGLTKSFLPLDKLQFNKNRMTPTENQNQIKNAQFFNSNNNSTQSSTICSPSYQYQTGQSSIQNRINYFNNQNSQLHVKSPTLNRNQQNIMLISQKSQRQRQHQQASNFYSSKTIQNDINKESNPNNNNDKSAYIINQFSSLTVTPTNQSSKNLQNKGSISITSQKIMQNQKQKRKQSSSISIKNSPTVFFSASNKNVNNANIDINQKSFIQQTLLYQNNQHRPLVFKPQTPQTSNIVRSHSRRSSVDHIQFNSSVNVNTSLKINPNPNPNNITSNPNNISYTSISDNNNKINKFQQANINNVKRNDLIDLCYNLHDHQKSQKSMQRQMQKESTSMLLSRQEQSKKNLRNKNYLPPRQKNQKNQYSSSKNIKLTDSLLIQKQFIVSSASKKSIDQHLTNSRNQEEDKKKFIIARRCQNPTYSNINSKQNSLMSNQINTSLDQYSNMYTNSQNQTQTQKDLLQQSKFQKISSASKHNLFAKNLTQIQMTEG